MKLNSKKLRKYFVLKYKKFLKTIIIGFFNNKNYTEK